jgi:EAL domain-containing protein (putative c-di-GMP-specific phosphodiesterase class I)
MLERDLKVALRSNRLQLHYQPQFVLKSGKLRGAEALIRWNHDELGAVPPGEFIRIAEESELILGIGLWVLNQACLDLRYLIDAGLHPGPISVNVSARQLRSSQFASQVVTILRKYDIHPGYLELEVTETAVAQSRETTIDILTKLRRIGVHIAMDDFGTGYSSLSYLQQLPFDVLKIDQSFVQQIGSEKSTDSICRAIVTMAHELDKRVIAEGVETAAQADFLSRCHCEYVQGYFYRKPMSQSDFFEFVRDQDSHTQRRFALEKR